MSCIVSTDLNSRFARSTGKGLDVDGVGQVRLCFLQISLRDRQNHEILTKGVGADIVDGQWETVLEVVNFCIEKGWPLRAGTHILA